jgi:tetratricopeptide (TPR) repeat protein
MGVVYKAQDLKLERPVALKFLPPDLTRDPEAKLRFVHEAKAASGLQHENICVVHDIDETADGQTFIVLDYYQGQTVKKFLAAGPLPLERAVDIAIQVGEGLAEAHRHGIVHRDIKPANIMITSQGKARIVDFGVALLAGLTRVTTDGHKVGTVTHMSPEQARGEPVDHRSDIWSLGVLLYEMLSGRLPFDSSYEQALVYAILNADPPLLSSLCPDAPRGLDRILAKALAKDTGQRYQRIDEMVRDLRGLASAPAGRSRKGHMISLKPERVWWLVVAGLGAAVLIAVAAFWFSRDTAPVNAGASYEVGISMGEFRNESGDHRADGWARQVRHTLLPGEFAGRTDLLLFHEGPAGGSVTFNLDGEIVRADSLFALQIRLEDPATGRLRWVATSTFTGPEGLDTAVSSAARHIVWFLEIRVLNRDLDPWIPRLLADSVNLWFLKAMTYTYSGQPGAEACLREAIRLDSTFVAPRVWQIPALVLGGTPTGRDLALRHYAVLEGVKSRATPFELAMIGLCECYLYGDLQCRANALERGLRYAPGNRIVLVNLGLAYYRLELYEKAVEAYAPAVESGMPYTDAYWEYARVLIKTGQMDRAQGVLEKALEIRPVSTFTYDYLAALAWKEGDSTRARSFELSAMGASEPRRRTWGEVAHSIGNIIMDLGEPRLALRFLRDAVQETPGAAIRRASLARALLAAGDTTGCERESLAALASDPRCKQAHALLGKLAQLRGHPDRAKTHFRAYLKQDSVTVTALDLRRRIAELESY